MDSIIVVSGLPRSGSSLMMAMLEAGGIQTVSDGARQPDEHNPDGYWEDSRVLQLAENSDWLAQCPGRAVKILYRQLYQVPLHFPLRVLLMERDLQEVVASQQKMLGAEADRDWKDLLGRDWRKFLTWLARQSQWPVLKVAFARLVDEPTAVVKEISDFLERPLQPEAMAACIKPALYRNRC